MCINSVKETCFSQKYQKSILSGFGNEPSITVACTPAFNTCISLCLLINVKLKVEIYLLLLENYINTKYEY